MASDLKNKTISGLIWGLLRTFGARLTTFVSTIVLARLLTPDDFGCIGVLSIFIMVSMAVIEGGFASALIQRENVTHDDESTVFFWNLFISVVLFFGLVAFSGTIADFYRIPQLSKVISVQSITLVIYAFGIIHNNRLICDLNFKAVAIIDTIASIVSIVVAIVLAYLDYGVWALVYQQISNSFVSVALKVVIYRWHPKLYFSFKILKSYFSYGSYLMLSNLMNNISTNLQGVVIGKAFNVATMGYYSQAKKLEEVPTTSISSLVAQVLFPVMAKLQNDKERLKSALSQMQKAMNLLNFPLMIGLIIMAKPIIILLFSEKWIPSVPFFQILCVAGIVNCSQSINYQLVSAVGRSKAIFFWNIVKRVIDIAFILIGLCFSVYGIMWGMVISMFITCIINIQVAQKSISYSIKEQILDNLPFLLYSVVSATLTYATMSYLGSEPIDLLWIIPLFSIIYCTLLFVFSTNEVRLIKRMILDYVR